ncbi:hypothetical protein JXB02_06595 [Candidatus Woesearchaeota archaeon]|nr:hypothetical protein [Candidatus Woesearchaeota archaeon]
MPTILHSREESREKYLAAVLDAATRRAREVSRPLSILDLATGANGLNPAMIGGLEERGIEYMLVISDVSPKWMADGYRLIQEQSPASIDRVVAVLADLHNLKEEVTWVQVWGEKARPIDEVLGEKRFSFLLKGYCGGERIMRFDDRAFDLIIGILPYGSAGITMYEKPVAGVMRLVADGGYHIVVERELVRINSDADRTMAALTFAVAKRNAKLKEALDSRADLEAWYAREFVLSDQHTAHDQAYQEGDTLKDDLFAHRKGSV